MIKKKNNKKKYADGGFIGPLTYEDWLAQINQNQVTPDTPEGMTLMQNNIVGKSAITESMNANKDFMSADFEGIGNVGNANTSNTDKPINTGGSVTLNTAGLIAGANALVTNFVYNPEVRRRNAQIMRKSMTPVTSANNFYGNNDMGMYMGDGGTVNYRTKSGMQVSYEDPGVFLPKSQIMPLQPIQQLRDTPASKRSVSWENILDTQGNIVNRSPVFHGKWNQNEVKGFLANAASNYPTINVPSFNQYKELWNIASGSTSDSWIKPKGTNKRSNMLAMYKDGGQVKYQTAPDYANAVVEGGEFMVTPLGETIPVTGDKHSDPSGGEYVNVPEGTRVYSNQIKADKDFVSDITNTNTKKKMTISKLAKKFNTDKEDKVLLRPGSDPIATRTANIMKAAKEQKLDEIFKYQELKKDPVGTILGEYAKGGTIRKVANALGEMMPEMTALINNMTDYPVYNAKYQPTYLPQAGSLDVQPALNRNYAQAQALLAGGSGSPSIDNARALQALSSLQDANDQIMGQKYNVDTQRRFQVDSTNAQIENQANLTNLQRTDEFWNKMTARQAVKEQTMNNIAESAYHKAKSKEMERRSLELVNEMNPNYIYDPNTGFSYLDRGQFIHNPYLYQGIGGLYNSADGVKTKESYFTDKNGMRRKRMTYTEDPNN